LRSAASTSTTSPLMNPDFQAMVVKVFKAQKDFRATRRPRRISSALRRPPHAAAAQLSQDAVMRDGAAHHRPSSPRNVIAGARRKSMTPHYAISCCRAGSASRSERTQGRGWPRVCQPAFRTECATAKVGQTKLPKAQPAELIQPGESSLYNPPPAAQSAPVADSAHREQWHNVAGAQTLPDRLSIIATVA
jgi:hypothetical protein